MKIKLIEFNNIKGHSGQFEFGDATLIYGRNFTGKTTVLDAIKLALLGYHPALDRTPQGIFKLSSGPDMAVKAVLVPSGSGGVTQGVSRGWKKGSSGKISTDTPVEMPGINVAVLDANAYFSATPRGKTELLFKAVQLDKPVDLQGLIDRCEAEPRRELNRLTKDAPAQDWLDAALEVVESFRSQTGAAIKRAEGALQGMGAARLKDGDAVLLPMDKIDEKLAKARASLEKGLKLAVPKDSDKLGDWRAEQARLINSLGIYRPALDRTREKYIKLLSLIEKERDEETAKQEAVIADAQTKLDTVNTSIKRSNAARSAVIDKAEEDVAELRETIADLERQRSAAAAHKSEGARMTQIRDDLTKLRSEHEQYKQAKSLILEGRDNLSTRMLEKVSEASQYFTAGIFPRLTFRDGIIGIYRGPDFVSNETFSGAEQAIAFAALQAALAAASPVKIVLMDELARLDVHSKFQLFANIRHALDDGVIEQFIGIDLERPALPLKDGKKIGFTYIGR